MYTLNNTINDILNDEVVMAHFGYMMPLAFLQIVPNEFRDIPLSEVIKTVKMPWGTPYLGQEVANVATLVHEIIDSDSYEFTQLWAEETPADFFPATDGQKMHVGLLKFMDSFKENRKMALVVPGGAYESVAISNEGIEVAKRLEQAGYAVAVLNYRCQPNRYPIPQMDLVLAIKYMRSYASKYNLQDDLMVVGFSAGGHLVASEACYYQENEKTLMEELKKDSQVLFQKFVKLSAKPDSLVLAYPVINFVSEQHEQSFENISGGDESLREKLSIDLHVTSDYPKTFVWACDDDELVPPSNASRMYEALKNVGVEAGYKSYPTGGHGIATGFGTSAEKWIDDMLSWMQETVS